MSYYLLSIPYKVLSRQDIVICHFVSSKINILHLKFHNSSHRVRAKQPLGARQYICLALQYFIQNMLGHFRILIELGDSESPMLPRLSVPRPAGNGRIISCHGLQRYPRPGINYTIC